MKISHVLSTVITCKHSNSQYILRRSRKIEFLGFIVHTYVTRSLSSVITNSKKDLVGQGKEAHVGSGDIASMLALIPGTAPRTTAAREPRDSPTDLSAVVDVVV